LALVVVDKSRALKYPTFAGLIAYGRGTVSRIRVVPVGLATPDFHTALEIEGGNEPVSVAVLDATRATVDYTNDVTAGQEWQLSAQPNWLLTPVAGTLPQSGFVAA